MQIHDLSARQQREQLRSGELSPVDLVEHYLERIERLDSPPSAEGGLGAFVTVTADAALARARKLERSGPTAAPLWGMPFADKDLVQRAGVRTTFGSRLFATNVPEESDALADALDSAGGVSLGKTNTPEFGMPSYTESRVAPPARNPYDTALGAGGSSGGAAVAVAAGLLPFAPGSDGGGSIRIPAAATGLVGLKPSRGLIPSGTALDSLGGLAVPGPIARTVGDAALLLDAMIAGGDYEFTVRRPRAAAVLSDALARPEGVFRLGVLTTSPWHESVDIRVAPEARSALDFALTALAGLGHGLDEISPHWMPYAEHFRTVWQAGAANLPAEGADLDLLEPLTRWLVEQGRALSARELVTALRALADFERSINRQFAPYDAIVSPALALTQRPVGWYDDSDPERNFEQQVQYTPFTSFVNVTGLPAISLPVAVTDAGLPMGIQLIGRPGGEHVLLTIGAQLERIIRWQDRHPPQWD